MKGREMSQTRSVVSRTVCDQVLLLRQGNCRRRWRFPGRRRPEQLTRLGSGGGGPRGGQSLMQRMVWGNDQLRGFVRAGDPRLELAAQIKDSHAAFRAMVVVPLGAQAQ